MDDKLLLSLYTGTIRHLDAENLARRIIAENGWEFFEGGFFIFIGKAAMAMAHPFKKLLNRDNSLIAVPSREGKGAERMGINSRIYLSGHPLPDKNSFEAAKYVLENADRISKRENVFLFVSGGASAAFELPKSEFNLDETRKIYRLLVEGGFTIEEINAIRISISSVKGGYLAHSLYPATVWNFIISDVLTPSGWLVGSGPGLAGPKVEREHFLSLALKKLEKSELAIKILGASLYKKLINSCQSVPDFRRYRLRARLKFMASPSDALLKAKQEAKTLFKKEIESGNFSIELFGAPAVEDVAKVSERYAEIIEERLKRLGNERVLLIGYGEPTVEVKVSGKGGRCLHLAALLATRFAGERRFKFLAASTDGKDGSSDLAGALVDGETLSRVRSKNLLKLFESEKFCKQGGVPIPSFISNTNVLDLHFALLG